MPKPNDTKSRIITAAAKLFFENGYEQTTLRQIAKQVGMTHVSILKHFDSKLELATQTINDYLNGLRRTCDALIASFPADMPDDYFRHLLWWSLHFKMLADNQPFRRFYISFYREGPVVSAQLIDKNLMDESPQPPFQIGEKSDFISLSLMSAADANLASLIDMGIIDNLVATKLIVHLNGFLGFIPSYNPDESVISEFFEAYLADIEVDILNDYLLSAYEDEAG
ncbi:MAG: TetR/AcrR family transcriptional regulator [Coriobacteriia bacterium]|nr:TetR/AcrR family transcriptional regulator [Coriobacteriia bacterium]